MTRRDAQGWMLLEMTYVIVLLGVFASLGSELFVLTFTVRSEAARTERLCVQWASVVEKLQRDVWSAAACETPDASTLRITTGNGDTITWQIGDGGGITRDDVTWPALGEGVTFRMQHGAVAMHVDRVAIRGGGEYLLPRAMQLAEAMR